MADLHKRKLNHSSPVSDLLACDLRQQAAISGKNHPADAKYARFCV